jgi:hypothetical protein
MKDVQETLDRLVPEPARFSDWDAVRRDARSKRRPLVLQVAGATIVVALAALFVVAPWKGSERVGILDRALAAVGDGPILHVVLRGDWGGTQVDMETGARTPVYGERELWYDAKRNLVHEISRFGGVVEREEVYNPKEPSTELASLSREYRQALKDGTARVTGSDVVDGIPVYWITVRRVLLPDVADQRSHEFAQRVAISRETFKPVATRDTRDGKAIQGGSQRVLRLETMPLAAADFTAASNSSMAERAMMFGSTPAPFESAAKILGRTPYWLGAEFSNLPLTQTQRARSAISPPGERRLGPEQTGLVFFYGKLGDDPSSFGKDMMPLWTEPHVQITQTTSRELLARGGPLKYLPPEGSVVLMPGPSGYLVRDGVYISILAQNDELILSAARALRPMS